MPSKSINKNFILYLLPLRNTLIVFSLFGISIFFSTSSSLVWVMFLSLQDELWSVCVCLCRVTTYLCVSWNRQFWNSSVLLYRYNNCLNLELNTIKFINERVVNVVNHPLVTPICKWIFQVFFCNFVVLNSKRSIFGNGMSGCSYDRYDILLVEKSMREVLWKSTQSAYGAPSCTFFWR